MRLTVATILTILAAAVQARLPTLWWLGGVRLDLLAALVVYGALSFPRGAAFWLALVAGLAQDALSAAPFGLSVLAYCLAAVALGAWRETLDRDLPWIQLGAGALVSLAHSVTSCLARGSLAASLVKMLLVAAVSGLITPFVFSLSDHLRQRAR